MPQNLLIIGATGVIGTFITEAIVNVKSRFGRVAVFTSEKTIVEKHREIAALDSYGVEVFVGDIGDENAVKVAYKGSLTDRWPPAPDADDSCAGIDTVVSCVGRGAIEKQIPLITWAAESGVTRFFPSEYGTDIEYWPQSAHEPPHQLKLKVRAHMETVNKLEHTYLVTGPYSDLYFGPMKGNPQVGSFNVREKKAVLLGTGDEPVSFTAMAE